MALEKEYNCPSAEEIITAAKPGVSAAMRDAVKAKLQACESGDEVLIGAKKFLEDHQYDFDALHHFLESTADFSYKKKKSSPIFSIKNLSIAAAFIVVLAGASWLFFFRESPRKIISKSFFYEPGLPVFASVDGNKEFHELMSAYRMKDAKTGLYYYHLLTSKEPLNDTLNYFGGWLYFLNDQHDSAALSFEKTTVIKQGIYLNKAQYMLAICLYLSNEKNKSKLILENIVQDKMNPYNEKAMDLLANKKLW